MTRRIFAITLAALLAALGTAGGLYLVMSAERDAQSRLTDALTVLVATTEIPAGTAGAAVVSEKRVRTERFPRVSLPSDALIEIGPELSAKVVLSRLAPGQILRRGDFGERTSYTSGLSVPDGMMALTVETSVPEQVAGFVQPGSQVTIFLTYRPVSRAGQASTLLRTRVLLPRVEVLSVGTFPGASKPAGGTAAGKTVSGSGSLLVTVAVSQIDAERLIEGLSYGTLYLTLLTGSTKVDQSSGVDNSDAGDPSLPLFR